MTVCKPSRHMTDISIGVAPTSLGQKGIGFPQSFKAQLAPQMQTACCKAHETAGVLASGNATALDIPPCKETPQ